MIFRTKPQLALEMVAAAAAEGVPFRWVGGDGVYGDSPTFVQGVRLLGKWYVLDSSADARVWTAEPRVDPARAAAQAEARAARAPSRWSSARRGAVDEVVAALPAAAWRRLTVAEGSQGPRVYEYAEVWAWFSEEGLPGPRERLLVRRSLGQEPELKYHRSNAPAEVPLLKLAQVRATRWTIEEDIKSGKGRVRPGRVRDAGLGRAGTTTRRCRCWPWRSWCCSGRGWGEKEPGMTVPEVRALLVHLLEVRAWDVAEILRWSAWRQERNRRAAASHRKRRLAERRRRQRSRAREPAL